MSFRVRICVVDSPDSRPSSNIQYSLDCLVRRNRSCEEVAAECQTKEMVLEVQPIVLNLVIGEMIIPILLLISSLHDRLGSTDLLCMRGTSYHSPPDTS